MERPPSEPAGLIPVCDLRAQFLSLEQPLRASLDRVLARSWFILGEELRQFEEEFARFLGTAHAVGLASGTEAIHLAVRALDIGPGDEVLTAPNSAVPTAAAIVEAGATPVFADVDPATGLLDPEDVERRLTPRVKAILPVHLFGRCAPMDPILELARRRGLRVIEDAAQAHGALWCGRRAGTMGDIGCFSFYPSKNLGAFGDAGACVTSDPALAQRLARLRNYGESDRYHSVEIGFNGRMDELQAAVLRTKLPHLEGWNRRRREIAAFYRARLQHLPLLLPPEPAEGDPDAAEVFHLFVIQVAERDRLREELRRRQVGTQIHYPIPIHLQPAFAYLGAGPGSYPRAEQRDERILSLPMYPELHDEQLARVADALADALRGRPHPKEIA
jgi:dTDP-4-amino-4,6-dideoxygalactose transaminase